MANLDDDLDYHITFPSPTSNLEAGATFAGPEPVEILEEFPTLNEEPVVILIGWAGCVDRHLSKYVEIYDSKGFITIRYTAPSDLIYKTQSAGVVQKVAAKLLDLIPEYELTHHSIFLHVFSNAGSIVYRHISHLTQNNGNYEDINIRGVTFDSAPTKATLIQGFHSYLAVLQKYNIFVRMFLATLLIAKHVVSHTFDFLSSLFVRKPTQVHFYEYLKSDTAPWPQLYLYSTADALCPAKEISDLVTHRQDNGFDVTDLCWDDSPHVGHFVVHREAYIQQCHSFVDKCLDN